MKARQFILQFARLGFSPEWQVHQSAESRFKTLTQARPCFPLFTLCWVIRGKLLHVIQVLTFIPSLLFIYFLLNKNLWVHQPPYSWYTVYFRVYHVQDFEATTAVGKFLLQTSGLYGGELKWGYLGQQVLAGVWYFLFIGSCSQVGLKNFWKWNITFFDAWLVYFN